MIPLEVIDALKDAGCTGDQILAAIRADQHRLLVRRMLRRARQALGVDTVESGFMTKDLALLVGADQKWLSTTGFLDKLNEMMQSAMK